MQDDTTALFAVVGLMVANKALFMLPQWWAQRWAFWSLQCLNLGAACALIWWGLPGFDTGQLKLISFVLAALMVMHILQNNRKLVAAKREQFSTEESARAERQAAILASLQADQEPPPEG